jgi:hypothetical protein
LLIANLREVNMTIQNKSQYVEPDAVWGAKEIGREIGRTKQQVFYLAKRNRLPGVKKLGNQLVGSRKILRELPAHISAA